MENNKIFEKEIGLISPDSFEKLNKTLIIIFGLGGVGGHAFDSLVRAGINNFIIVDKDIFDITNCNRQLMADALTISKDKVVVYADRAKRINPNVKIIGMKLDVKNHINDIMNMKSEFESKNLFMIDMIDDIDAKLEIIKYAKENSINIISSMGTANHISTENIKICDINKTSYCPIAKIMRKKLKEINIDKLDVLYIDEEQIKCESLKTISYVPACCGLKISEYVIRKII